MNQENFKPNKFLVEWDIRSDDAKASLYEGNINYLLIIHIEGDLGGGAMCFVSQDNYAVVKSELQY